MAERLISSIRRRCRRTFASSSLSRSGETDGAGSGLGSSLGSSATTCRLGASTTGNGSGAVAAAATAASTSAMRRDAVKRPNMIASARYRELALADRRHRVRGALGFRRNDQLAQRGRDVVAGLHLIKRNAAVDRLAHEAEIVRDRAGKRLAERLLDIGAAQARPEQALLEAVDDDLRLRAVGKTLADHVDQMARVLQSRHGHLGDQKQAI